MRFINDICFKYGDMAWLILPPTKRYNTNDILLLNKNHLMIVGIDNDYVSFIYNAIYIHK